MRIQTETSNCSTWNGMTMTYGLTATTAIPTNFGTMTTGSCSSSRKFFCFPSFGGFYFSDLIHPPSILPISSIFSDREMYLLLSIDFISQDI